MSENADSENYDSENNMPNNTPVEEFENISLSDDAKPDVKNVILTNTNINPDACIIKRPRGRPKTRILKTAEEKKESRSKHTEKMRRARMSKCLKRAQDKEEEFNKYVGAKILIDNLNIQREAEKAVEQLMEKQRLEQINNTSSIDIEFIKNTVNDIINKPKEKYAHTWTDKKGNVWNF